MDDAVLGGEKGELEGGKRGRKGPNKVPFVIAVATTDDGRPQRLLLQVAQHTGEDIERVARTHIAPSARVVSDGLGCFRAVTRAGCRHEPIVAAHEPSNPRRSPPRWVNTMLVTKTASPARHDRRPYVPRTAESMAQAARATW